jgi:hypothetical protein
MLSRVDSGLSCVLAEFSRWLVGGLVRGLGVSGCRIRRHHQNGEGEPLGLGQSLRRGGAVSYCLEEGKRERNFVQLLTKL